MMLLCGSFDPVTSDDLILIKEYRKQHHLHDLGVMVDRNEGIAPCEVRMRMLKEALRPYRHLHPVEQCGNADRIEIQGIHEKEAREGKYRYIADGARQIVFENGVYLDETVKAMCRPHRAIHSHGVAETAAELARAHHLDAWKAYEMGMLHDITKAFSDEENRRIIASWKPEWLSLSPKVWHSYTAAVWMKQEMNWHDEKMIHAIEHHTLGDGKSDYDRILYIADKIEPSRGYDVSVEKALACRDLHAGAQLILKESEEYRKTKEHYE